LIDLSFLGAGRYDALAAKDDPADAASVKVEKSTATPATALAVDLRAGGGFIVRLTTAQP
jgi:alpha-glucosidase